MAKHTQHTDCPVTKTVELLSDAWTMRIVHTLLDGAHRFCELERALPGISTRTLTVKLRELETAAVLIKKTNGTYEITEKGAGLRAVAAAMRRYGEQYL